MRPSNLPSSIEALSQMLPTPSETTTALVKGVFSALWVTWTLEGDILIVGSDPVMDVLRRRVLYSEAILEAPSGSPLRFVYIGEGNYSNDLIAQVLPAVVEGGIVFLVGVNPKTVKVPEGVEVNKSAGNTTLYIEKRVLTPETESATVASAGVEHHDTKEKKDGKAKGSSSRRARQS